LGKWGGAACRLLLPSTTLKGARILPGDNGSGTSSAWHPLEPGSLEDVDSDSLEEGTVPHGRQTANSESFDAGLFVHLRKGCFDTGAAPILVLYIGERFSVCSQLVSSVP